MKNEAAYLRPIGTTSALVSTGTHTVDAYATVVRVYAAAETTLTFGGTGTVVKIAAAFPEYFRTAPGEVLTAGGALEVTNMA